MDLIQALKAVCRTRQSSRSTCLPEIREFSGANLLERRREGMVKLAFEVDFEHCGG